MDGFGNINWWGFSPSINLLDDMSPKLNESSEEINILVVCAGDQRHIIRTLAELAKLKNKTPNTKKINFYIYEKMLELYARDFLLLSVLLEHPAKRGVQEKTELFLEIFGNLFVRDHTSKYLQNRANEFIHYITDLGHLHATDLNLFNFELLKYKERDFLEGIFKFWRLENEPGKPYFPAEKCWDFRLRSYFGTRYDTRKNAYDWDFSMKLSDRKHAAVIHHKLYARWRETGVAFDMRDSEYDKANFTLASATCLTDPRSGDKTGD
jgi:dynein assembly factor 3